MKYQIIIDLLENTPSQPNLGQKQGWNKWWYAWNVQH